MCVCVCVCVYVCVCVCVSSVCIITSNKMVCHMVKSDDTGSLVTLLISHYAN